MIPAIAFKAKDKQGRYLCDGIECMDWEDEQGDTAVLSEAFLIIRNDLSVPDEKDVEDCYMFIAQLPLSNDVEAMKANYDPVPVVLTQSELKIVRDRNEW